MRHKTLNAWEEEQLVLDWRKKQQAPAAVQLAIEDWLDWLPAAYLPSLWE